MWVACGVVEDCLTSLRLKNWHRKSREDCKLEEGMLRHFHIDRVGRRGAEVDLYIKPGWAV